MEWLGLGLIMLGLLWIAGFIIAHHRAVARAAAAEGWPSVPGEVVASRIGAEESADSEGGTTTWYMPVLRYRYAVDGRELEGRRLRFGSVRTADLKRAEAWLAPYPAGARVEVRYDPADPAEAVLETRPPAAGYLWAASAGLAFAGLGLFAMMG